MQLRCGAEANCVEQLLPRAPGAAGLACRSRPSLPKPAHSRCCRRSLGRFERRRVSGATHLSGCGRYWRCSPSFSDSPSPGSASFTCDAGKNRTTHTTSAASQWSWSKSNSMTSRVRLLATLCSLEKTLCSSGQLGSKERSPQPVGTDRSACEVPLRPLQLVRPHVSQLLAAEEPAGLFDRQQHLGKQPAARRLSRNEVHQDDSSHAMWRVDRPPPFCRQKPLRRSERARVRVGQWDYRD